MISCVWSYSVILPTGYVLCIYVAIYNNNHAINEITCYIAFMSSTTKSIALSK
jgi:hypothetical protein